MDNEKIGTFIKTLRNEKRWSQEQLAEKMYVSRQAISNWEMGKNLPDISKLNVLADLFNLEIAEIYSGEKLENQNQKNVIVGQLIKNEQQKRKKVILISLILIVLLIILFLFNYFISFYKQTKIYTLNGIENGIEVNGFIFKMSSTVFFELNVDKNIDKLVLLYKDNSIIQTDSNVITFKEVIGRNEYITNSNFSDFINNLYLDIYKKDKKENIKLNVKMDFINSDLFFTKAKAMYK